ncbi:MAG: prepilin-type N-terminal cleavage/methylation domain-containing protein [Candidatus Peribacteria bacterium]|jgi:prepilin-type N-terminal cleavage/methylation domain-containing protein|nr:prepilin-type N-terminal cleavage/methylation domain-containing protein [Candidatus Peribacteria bacterium]
MNSLNFVRSKHSPLNKGRQEGIFYKTLIPNHSPFERRSELREIVKNPPTPFIKGEIYSFPSPLTGESKNGREFKKNFHSIPSPLGRGLGRGFTLVEIIVVVTILAIL